MEAETTDVIFRKFRDGEVIALFPGIAGTMDPWSCSSYMHVGQHGAAGLHSIAAHTKLASEREYAPLKRELESVPYEYRLRVVKRATSKHRKMRDQQIQQ